MSDEFPVKIREVRVRHKSGTIYVERRHCRYDPELQHNVVVKSERIGKIDPETGQIVPCRPKRRKTETVSDAARKPAVEAPSLALALGLAETTPTNGYAGESERTGLAKLFDLVGRASGLEACVRYAFPEEKDADKILAVARYWAATDDPLRRIESRRREENDLFPSGLDAVCDFFEMLGHDESGMDALFTRLVRLDDDVDSPVLVFESSARSGSSAPRGGLVPDLSAQRLLTVYATRTRLPVAFELLSGTVTDIVGLKRAAKLAKRFELARPEFVLESARSEEGFLAELLRNRIRFTALVDLSEEWVREPLEEAGSSKRSALEELDTWGSLSPFDSSVNGVARCRTVEFPRTHSASRSGQAADDIGDVVETKPYRLYLHYFRDANAAHSEREEHKALVYSLKSALEGGTSLDELTEGERAIAEKYLVLSRGGQRGRGGKLQVAFNDEALREAERRYGIFCIASNTHKDPWKVLRRCRMRNRIEESFCTSPTRRVGDRTRVWSVFQARGREVCRLAALGYRFYMQSILNAVRDEAAHLAYGTRSSMANAVDYGDVRRLLEDMPLRNLMAYLDCPEALKRDRLLFEMLSNEAYRTIGERRWEETLPHEEVDPL